MELILENIKLKRRCKLLIAIIILLAVLVLYFGITKYKDAETYLGYMEEAVGLNEEMLAYLETERAENEALTEELEDLKAHCSVFPLTLDERKYVEQVVMSEAGNQPFEGQCAVAQAIRDRHRMWNQSIDTVLSAPAQFVCNPKYKVTPEVRAAVSYTFDEGKSTFKDPITHFHTLDSNPPWAKGKTYMGSIGNHKFYY